MHHPMTRTMTTTVTTDPKIDRIHQSWLQGDIADAAWLATAADELVVPAGTTIAGDRFVHLLLDTTDRCTVVARGVSPVTVTEPTRVLVFPETEAREATTRFPALLDAWAASLDRCGAAATA